MRNALAVMFAILVAVAARDAHAGACATPGWAADILTKPNQVIPANGGIVAGIRSSFGGGGASTANPAMQSWVLRSGTQTVPLKAESLAPGLARYTPSKAAGASGWQVQPRNAKRAKTFGPDRRVSYAKAPSIPLAAPAVASVHHFSRKIPSIGRHGGTRFVQYVQVVLSKPSPPRALGLILYDGTKPDGAPMLFRRTGAGLTNVTLFSTPGRCQPWLRAWQRPAAGHKVTAAWIDEGGVLSKRSSVVAVVGSEPKRTGPVPPGAMPLVPPGSLPPGPPPPAKTGQPKPAHLRTGRVTTDAAAPAAPKPPTPPADKKSKGCSTRPGGASWLVVLGALLVLRRRRAVSA